MPAEEEEPAPEVLERVSRSALIGGLLLLLVFLFASLLAFWIFTDTLSAKALGLPAPLVDWRHYLVALLASGAVLSTSIPQIYSKYVRWSFTAPHVLVPLIGAILGAVLFALPLMQLPSPPWVTLLGTPYESFFFVGIAAAHGLAMVGYPMTQRLKWSLPLKGLAFTPMVVTLLFAILAFASNSPNLATLGSINLAIVVSLTGYTMALTAFMYHYTTITTTLVRVESVMEADEGEVRHLKAEIKVRNERVLRLKEFAASLEALEGRAIAKTLAYAQDDDPVLIALKSNITKLIARGAGADGPASSAAASPDSVGPKSEKAVAKAQEGVLKNREKELKDLDWELGNRAKELDKRMADLVKREGEASKNLESAAVRLKEVEMRNSALKAQEERASTMLRDTQEKSEKSRAMNDEARTKLLEAQAKEKMVQDREREIMKVDAEIRRREREAEARASELRRLEDHVKQREESLNAESARQKTESANLAEKAAEVRATESTFKLRAKSLESASADSEHNAAMMKRIEEQNQQMIQKEKELAVLRGKLEETQRELSTAMKFAEDKRQHYEREITAVNARERALAEKEADTQIAKSKLESQQRDLLQVKAGLESEKRSVEEKRGPGMLTRLQKGQEMDVKMREDGAEFRKRLDSVAIDPGAAGPRAGSAGENAAPTIKVEEAEKRVDELALRIGRLAAAAKGPAAGAEASGEAGADAPRVEPTPPPPARPAEAGMAFGIPRLEELMGGEVPRGRTLLLSGPPFIGKDVLIARGISSCIVSGLPVVVLTTSRPTEEWGRELLAIDQGHLAHMRSGLVKWIDLVSSSPPGGNAYMGNVSLVQANAGLDELWATIRTKAPARGKFVIVIASLSTLLQMHGVGPTQEWLRKILALVRERDGNGLVSIERGTHSEQEYEAVVSVLHGVLSLKKDGLKTMLSVEGLERAQSRDWVEYTVDGRTLKVGAFSLERIR